MARRAVQIGIVMLGIAAAGVPAAAEEMPRLRVPLSLQAGYDMPLGTAGLGLAIETPGGWAVGGGVGFKAGTLGGSDWMLAVNGRAPLVRVGRFDLAGLVSLSRGDRIDSRLTISDNTRIVRWLWDPGYRVDLGLSARLLGGPWGLRIDVGVGYLLNAPRCYYSESNSGGSSVFLPNTDCGDPAIPADENTTDVRRRFAPFVALVGEYDLAGGTGPTPAGPAATDGAGDGAATAVATGASGEDPARDRREANAWLAPTALTLGRGGVRVTLYDGFAPELAVGITERLQASAAFATLGGDFWGWKAELKLGMLTRGRFRLAAVANGLGFNSRDAAAAVAGAGGVASVCFDEACRTLASLAIQAGTSFETGGERERGIAVSPSVIIGLGSRVKLVGESHVIPGEGIILVGLVRVPVHRFVLDVGVASDARDVLPAGSLGVQF